tara:strand:- start:81675 stop:84341 length:2667 start_codon:yes stop_codon:yes gene_type:complete
MKTKLFSFGLFMSLNIMAQNTAINELSGAEQSQKTSQKQISSRNKTAAANIIWSEDFSNGIPNGWTNRGHSGDVNIFDPNAIWEYRGSITNPTFATGSRGAWAGTGGLAGGSPIASPTATNGFVIFDSDYLDNNGVQGAAGTGPSPAPHVGDLTTDTINLLGKSNIQITVHSYLRYFAGRNLMAFSTDGGLTWGDTIRLHNYIAVNSSSSLDEISTFDISNIIGNEPYAMIRFIYDGSFNEPAANGQGYYFWMLDDIVIEEIPDHALDFAIGPNNAPKQDITFNGEEKTGNMLENQVNLMSFDANIVNVGGSAQTNVKLQIDILKNGQYLSSIFSSNYPLLNPGDTADFNSIYTPPFTPNGIGNYSFEFKAISDSIPVANSSISPMASPFSINVNSLADPQGGQGLDFGINDNSLGTDNIGHDGSAMAIRLKFSNPTDTINAVPKVKISHMLLDLAVGNGGDLVLEAYEARGFDYINGFAAAPLFSVTHTINNLSTNLEKIDIRSSPCSPIYLDVDTSYYFVVYMFSNAGSNPIRVWNDQTVNQPGNSSIFYNADDARWYRGYSGGSRTFASPRIRVANLSLTEDTISACSPFVWTNGQVFTSSNYSALDTLQSVLGCDSIVRLHLDIIPPSDPSIDSVSACGSYTWIDGITYTSSNNTALDTLINSMGCDSLVQLNLTIINTQNIADSIRSCGPYLWRDGQVYNSDTSSVNYTVNDGLGCSTTYSLHFTNIGVDTNLTIIDSLISVQSSGQHYQWFECGPGGIFTKLVGDSLQNFIAPHSGAYAVVVSNEFCSDTSSCVYIETIGSRDWEIWKGVTYFPNPNNGKFHLNLGQMDQAQIRIKNTKGQLVYSNKTDQNTLDISLNEAAGLYFLEIQTETDIRVFKVLLK